MAALELYHRIFTHATDAWRTIGWRHVTVARDAQNVLSPEALTELDSLMEKLVPQGGEEAWALRRFAAGDEWFGCVIVSYRGFEDAGGRGGLLNHARLVRLVPDDSWLNPVPLIEEAFAFPIGEVRDAPAPERLQKYLDAMADDATLAVPQMSASLLEELDRKSIHDVVVATLWSLQTRTATRLQAPDVPLKQLALAWAALPAGLQQRSSFAWRAADGVPVDAIWAESGTRPSTVGSKPLADCVTKYLNLLLESSYDHSLLVRDMNVRTAGDFQQLVDRATIAAGVPAGERSREEGEMAVRKTNTPQRREEGSDFDLAELDRQQQAMYQSLRDYIDKRLAAYETARRGGPRAPVAAATSYRLIAATALATLLLVLVTQRLGQWIGRQQKPAQKTASAATTTTTTRRAKGTAGTVAPATTSSPVDLQPVHAVIAKCTIDKDWASAFATFTKTHPLLFALIVDRAKNDTLAVPEPMRRELENYSTRLHGTGPKMNSKDLEVLRPLLFEYAVKQQAADKTIDGNFNDVTTELLETFNLKSSTKHLNAWKLQSEVILRWIAKNGNERNGA